RAYCSGRAGADTVCRHPAPSRHVRKDGRLISLVERIRRFTRRDIAKDTVTGFGFEGSLLLSSMLSFGLLGRSLGPSGFGDYASLYAIATPLTTLASTGAAPAHAQPVARDRRDPRA